jgi:hypothetical protein
MINPLNSPYELTNHQRQYFGLNPVQNNWEKIELSSAIAVYFDQNNIVKILEYSWGYQEYDTSIETIDREILLPQTTRGKQQKLTTPRLLKIKGSSVQFSGSFLGGNIQVYDNRRNATFIKSYAEDGDMKSYADIETWISNYIATAPTDYFEWLNNQLTHKKLRIKIKTGDIIAYKLSRTEFGFARVLVNVYDEVKNNTPQSDRLSLFHPRSLIVAPYIFWADTQNPNPEELATKPTLPTVCIFDMEVYRGEMLIIGHMPLSEKEKQIPIPAEAVTSVTLNITKRDLHRASNTPM